MTNNCTKMINWSKLMISKNLAWKFKWLRGVLKPLKLILQFGHALLNFTRKPVENHAHHKMDLLTRLVMKNLNPTIFDLSLKVPPEMISYFLFYYLMSLSSWTSLKQAYKGKVFAKNFLCQTERKRYRKMP